MEERFGLLAMRDSYIAEDPIPLINYVKLEFVEYIHGAYSQ